MSIALPAGLPARPILLAEGVDVVAHDSLSSWGRRPLRLCLVNLMPNKPVTETQIARLVGSTSIPVDLTLCLPDGYRSKSLPEAHRAFYRPWSDISHQAFDALIVTGAPIEGLAFEEVDYWSGLSAILDWARSRSIAGLYICWAAQAALYRYHGVSKRSLPQKMFGIYRQRVTCQDQRLLRGFGEEFPVPVSRHTEVSVGDLPVGAGLCVLAASAESGLCLVADRTSRAVYMFNHLEYDAGTLREEFQRDRTAGKPVGLPRNYFPDDDPRLAPANSWRPFGHLLIANWLGEISRTAQPRVSDEAVIQWALAGSRPANGRPTEDADFLIGAAAGTDVLTAALRLLADAGIAPFRVKVHRDPGCGQLIELRAGRLAAPAMERIARRLCSISAVAKVAFRTAGEGGWLVRHRAEGKAESLAPPVQPSNTNASSEAA